MLENKFSHKKTAVPRSAHGGLSAIALLPGHDQAHCTFFLDRLHDGAEISEAA